MAQISMDENEEVLAGMKNLSCRICNNSSGNKTHTAREMYLGLRDEFEYLECSQCGCLQLLNPPSDFTKYYPDSYFTFKQNIETGLKAFLNTYRDKAAMGDKNLLGMILYSIFGEPTYISRLKKVKIGYHDSVLDVGCGKGILLHRMKQCGFQNLMGIDPFISETLNYDNGLIIKKIELNDVEGKFDLIMFNHSFEHMENPFAVLTKTRNILNKDKFIIIRIPVADSFAWKKYGVHWSSLEAPRHLFLHTKKSIRFLAENIGFSIDHISYDSRSWQLWGSEQYAKDIHLLAMNSYFVNPAKSIFSKDDIYEYEKKTEWLNKTGEGDQAEFYLRRI